MAINKVKSPTVFMLHGFLGSGKTTFARHLEHKYTALRFTHDEWMQQLYGIDPRRLILLITHNGCSTLWSPYGRDALSLTIMSF